MSRNSDKTVLEVARDYLRRGWKPVPVPYREKGPKDRDWHLRKITSENIEDYFDSQPVNIGLQLGRASGGLTDVDLDCAEAVWLADFMLAPTASFGRQSKPRSHRLYTTDLHATEQKATIQYREPKTLARDAKPCMLVELRIGAGDKGAQTVAPGSVHPSGERIEWDEDKGPKQVDGKELKDWIAALAAGTLLLRNYPREGERHEAALVLGGVLARLPDIKAGDVELFVREIALAAGDEEAEERGRSAASAIDLLNRGQPTPGIPRMREVWGEALTDTIAKWLNIGSGREDSFTRSDGGMPIIRIREGGLADGIDQAQDALLAANVPIFVRGGMLVEPITLERQAHYRLTKVTVFAPLSERKLAYLLNKYAARFEHWDGRRKAYVEIDPPLKVTAGLMQLRNWRFPEVVGVIGTPTMRPDGSILCTPGYDPATRLWCESDIRLPAIAEKPSRTEAERALELLKQLLSGFPFVTGVDRAVALAAIKTIVLRGAFDLSMLQAIFAHASGTGKSYLVDLIANIATGRDCPVITVSKSIEEMEKRLGAILLEGSSVTSLDNMSCDLSGDLLGQISTQTIIKIRVLGKSETPECEWKGTLFATGNNIQVVGDQVRRTLVCNLDAGVENPEQREFAFDPIEKVHQDRAAYIAAVITIARAYAASGERVKDLPPLVGFDGWSRVVREPLVWLGEADPVKSMEAARTADPERAALADLIWRWEERIGFNKPVTAAEIKSIADTMDGESRNAPPQWRWPKFRALLVEHAGSYGKGDVIDPVRLGKWLTSVKGKVSDGCRIEQMSRKGTSNQYMLVSTKPSVEYGVHRVV